MRTIGFIVSKGAVNSAPEYISVVKSIEECICDKPILIVGYELAKSLIDDFSPIQKVYNGGNIRWTFSKTERRNEYDDDIKNFSQYVIDRLLSRCTYRYVDLTKVHQKDIERVKGKIIESDAKLTVWDAYQMLYILSGETVFGVSKDISKYCKMDDKVKEVLNTSNSLRYIKKEEKEIVNCATKGCIGNRFKVYFTSKML